MHLSNWYTICLPPCQEGLGLRKTHLCSPALIAKQILEGNICSSFHPSSKLKKKG